MNDNISADAAPPNLSIKKRRYLRWLAAAAVLFVAWFCWQLFGPNPAIIVSHETTYITAPLRPNGLPNYRQHLLDLLRNDITFNNNAAVLMWQAFGPGRGSSALEPAEWEHIVQELNLPHVDSSGGLLDPSDRDTAERVERWVVANDPVWKQAFATPPAIQDGDPLPSDLGYDVVFAAMDAPWRREQLPPLAEWVDASNDAIDLLVKASQRPRLYIPYDHSDSDGDFLADTMPMDGIMRSRDAAHVLVTRAMFHLGEGRHAEAWQDLLAIHRWARLIDQGPTLLEQLVAVAIDGIACDADAALLANDELPLDLARQIHHDLQNLPPPANLATSFDKGERFYFLDMITLCENKGIGALAADNVFMGLAFGDSDHATWTSKLLNRVSADWNVALAEGNRWYDRLAAAARLPEFTDRRQAFSQLKHEIHDREASLRKPGNWIVAALSNGKRNEMLANAMIAALSPAVTAALEANDRAIATLELTQLAAALAVYRAEHDHYPDKLDALVPGVIPELPVDLYHAKPFIYQRDADGYLLYSTGENATDDGGSNEKYGGGTLAGRELDFNDDPATEKLQKQIPAGADDLSIRVPRPAFKLPNPPATTTSQQ